MENISATTVRTPERSATSGESAPKCAEAACRPAPNWGLRAAIGVAALATLAAATLAVAEDPRASAFAAENNAAMIKMMSAMDIRSSGDVDRDFAAMMIPHHQGAIEMAIAELRYGSNELLRRMAQEIIVEQQQEIAAMHLALGQPLPPPAPAGVAGPRQARAGQSPPATHRHTAP